MLFVYWFRYTCLLILSAKTSRDYAAQVASANQLSFLDTRDKLIQQVDAVPLDNCRRALDRDYKLLTYLLDHAVGPGGSGGSIENRILMLDFKLMSIWYSVVRHLSPPRGRSALIEMSSIVNHLANSMGERMALSAGA
jgi:hypothetical protein